MPKKIKEIQIQLQKDIDLIVEKKLSNKLKEQEKEKRIIIIVKREHIFILM